MNFFKRLFGKAKRAAKKVGSAFDKMGAYTGVPSDGDASPTQDADDL